MKVNIYDPENIQKGRLMMLNIAEDLKDAAKIKVAPGGKTVDKKKDAAKGEGKKSDASDYD